MKTNLSVKLDDDTHERLKNFGISKDRSSHWLMLQAIHRYLETEERVEREKDEDDVRWRRYTLTGEHVSDDDAMAILDGLVQRAKEAEDI